MLHTKDEKARDLILAKEATAERGTMICFSPWNAEVQTLDNEWFTRS